MAVRIASLAALLAGLAALAAPAPAAAVDLAPHRAIYELSLAAARGSQPVASVDGGMQFEWTDVCDGWTVRNRARMQVVYGESGAVSIGWTFNAWEADDGLSYRFFIQRFRNGQKTEEVRGKARLEGAGGAGVARFTEPEEREVELPAGTLFPKAHTELLLARARAGEATVWRRVFDGSGEAGGLYEVNAVRVESYGRQAEAAFPSPLIEDVASWRFNVAYFEAGQEAATPVHEQVLRLYANGVGADMLLDYDDFALDADLTELEALERPEC